MADYKVANYIDKDDFNESTDSKVENRSCYSFCMCPGGQVSVPWTYSTDWFAFDYIGRISIIKLLLCFNFSKWSTGSNVWNIGTYRLFSQVQVHLKYASMACHFLAEHLGGQMLHLWCQSQRMILKLWIIMVPSLVLSFRLVWFLDIFVVFKFRYLQLYLTN